MRTIVIALFLAVYAMCAYSQVTELEDKIKTPKKDKEKEAKDSTEGWKMGGVTTINFAQTTVKNWAAGGKNSIALNSLVNLFANYKKGKSTWDNTLDLGYGTIKQGNEDASIFQKSEDRIDFSSKYGRVAFNKNWYYAGMLNFKSQMTRTPDYNFPDSNVTVSNFMAPAYLLIAMGLDYKPSDNFTVFFAPVTGKVTFVNDASLTVKYGLEVGEKSRKEFGGYLKSMFKTNLMKNVALTTKLDLFSNYSNKPQNIDVNWELLIAMKINKFLSANIQTRLIYDDDVMINIYDNNQNIVKRGPRAQFMEVFGLGLSFKF
ncbi:MAG: hypothetical protein A2W91_18245 [Bacteroidetes bacterium GWF2_38_335]|nr:MAG: hypothetical protein A2W91_18245 [Bacteroidetes bacterium GWF2_38_335]OFY80093.1 MAG: hypothetical protein A2281_12395 [Bacteroidetes bacterium RIFOXYA12_FULL_38_20]HBS88581.1 hypothetical protein [Bacteroidales bacterium]